MLEGFRRWFSDPLDGGDETASALDYFLFVGFILTCVIIWRLVLSHIVND